MLIVLFLIMGVFWSTVLWAVFRVLERSCRIEDSGYEVVPRKGLPVDY